MEKVDFTFKRGGRTKTVTATQAKVLQRAGLGTYQTRDMAFQPMQTKPMLAAAGESAVHVRVDDPDAVDKVATALSGRGPAVVVVGGTVTMMSADDGLAALDKDQLHALAKERGVRVHHLAGADRVRAALREQ